jgi:hypothetical protein
MAVSVKELKPGEIYATDRRLQVYRLDRNDGDPTETWIGSGVLLKFTVSTTERIYHSGRSFTFGPESDEWGPAQYDLSIAQLDFITHIPRS